MKLRNIVAVVGAIGVIATSMTACTINGPGGNSPAGGHEVDFGGDLNDLKPISLQVREKLRNNAQTALARIQVSTPNADTVRLTGFVDNDGIRQEAERLAYQVNGVRFVVNTIEIRR